jgi:transitional endoplasmic reticulum ATPase
VNVVGLDDETADVEVLNSMAVANGHFQTALSSSNLSALRETASETAFTLLLLDQITI